MKRGFTLVELLVVVLIIGILAAAALPQYQKAVWKSRAAEMLAAVKSLSQAQEVYNMANGSYAEAFDVLDVDYSQLPEASLFPCSLGGSDYRQKDFITMSLNQYGENGANYVLTDAAFNQGPYECGGFVYVHKTNAENLIPGKLYCWNSIRSERDFCAEVMGGTKVGQRWAWDFYTF